MEEHVWLGCFGKAKKQKALQSLGWMHSLRCERGKDTNGAYESNSKTQQSQKAQQASSSYGQCTQCEVEKPKLHHQTAHPLSLNLRRFGKMLGQARRCSGQSEQRRLPTHFRKRSRQNGSALCCRPRVEPCSGMKVKTGSAVGFVL